MLTLLKETLIYVVGSVYIAYFIENNTRFLENQSRFVDKKTVSSCCTSKPAIISPSSSCCINSAAIGFLINRFVLAGLVTIMKKRQ